MRKVAELLVLVLLTSCAFFHSTPKRNQNIDGIIFLEDSDDEEKQKNSKSVRKSKEKKQQGDSAEVRNFKDMEGIIYLNYEDQINENPDKPLKPNHHLETGKASYYAMKFKGRKTASGEIYDPDKLTAAHPKLPFGTMVRVTNLYNNASVIVRINDRGPHVKSRIIDLSYAAAKKLDIITRGLGEVAIEVIKNP